MSIAHRVVELALERRWGLAELRQTDAHTQQMVAMAHRVGEALEEVCECEGLNEDITESLVTQLVQRLLPDPAPVLERMAVSDRLREELEKPRAFVEVDPLIHGRRKWPWG